MALLMPDPCDPHCPEEFKPQARELLLGDEQWASLRMGHSVIQTDEGLRQILLKFIADFANWYNATKTEYLGNQPGIGARQPIQRKHPLVVDPFAGWRVYPILKP